MTVSVIGLDGLPDLAETIMTGTRDSVAPMVAMVRGLARQVKQGDETAYEVTLRIRDGRVTLGAMGLIPIGRIPALQF